MRRKWILLAVVVMAAAGLLWGVTGCGTTVTGSNGMSSILSDSTHENPSVPAIPSGWYGWVLNTASGTATGHIRYYPWTQGLIIMSSGNTQLNQWKISLDQPTKAIPLQESLTEPRHSLQKLPEVSADKKPLPPCKPEMMQEQYKLAARLGPSRARSFGERVTRGVGNNHSQGDKISGIYIIGSGGVPISCTITVRYLGTGCYVCTDDASTTTITDDQAKSMGKIFDEQVRTPMTNLFGEEWSPGIDGDPRVYLIVSSKVGDYGALGYHMPLDEWPAAGNPITYTNEGEILYFDTKVATDSKYVSTIPHEYQHLIYTNQKYKPSGGGAYPYPTDDDTMINEGLSTYAEDVPGFGMLSGGASAESQATWVYYYLSSPQDTLLLNWLGSGTYGGAKLLAHYLVDQYGTGIIHSNANALNTNSQWGKNSIALATGKSFDTVWRNWVMANYFDGIVTNQEFNYSSLDVRGTYGGITLPGATLVGTTSTYPYSIEQPLWPGYLPLYIGFQNPNGRDLDLTATGVAADTMFVLLYK